MPKYRYRFDNPYQAASLGSSSVRPEQKETAPDLVMMESPAKARTIEGYFGRGYEVESSIDHIRDLSQSAANIAAKVKGSS